MSEQSGTNRSNSNVSAGLAGNGELQLSTTNREDTDTQKLRIDKNTDVFMDDGQADGRKKTERTTLGTHKLAAQHHIDYDRRTAKVGASEGSHHYARKGNLRNARSEAAKQLSHLRSQLSKDRANEKNRRSLS